MSQENVEIVHRLKEAWNRGDLEAILSLFDRNCEVAAWDSHHAEVVETIEVGESVLVMLHLVGRGVGSGIELDETDAHVFTFRGGRITNWRTFNERHEALEAGGLSE